MKRKKACGLQAQQVWISLIVLTLLSVATSGDEQGKETHQQKSLWEELAAPRITGGSPHRVRRQGVSPRSLEDRPLVFSGRRLLAENETTAQDKSIWEEIDEFYADPNNMAMYCVLPLIVIVYGGCSVIYCIYKCRRAIRRRRHKDRHSDTEGLVEGDEKNDLNQEGGDSVTGSDNQPIKTVSSSNWDNVQRKKTPLPWDNPQQNKPDNASTPSPQADSSTTPTPTTTTINVKPPPPPEAKLSEFGHVPASNPRPVEIVPITRQQYQDHVQSGGDVQWDPLHHRPFGSRAESAVPRQSGRESAWSIRDEIMAKYDALTSLAMAKKTADVLRRGGGGNPNLNNGHCPDSLRRKPGGKKKLIFIAE